MKRVVLASACAMFIGCGSSGSDLTISSQPLSGTFGGEAWTIGGGRAMAGFDLGDIEIELHPGAAEYTGRPDSMKFILLFTKAEVATYTFSLQQNATFVTEVPMEAPRNQVATNGKLQIESLTETMVKGGLVAVFDGSTQVNGTFEIPRCPTP